MYFHRSLFCYVLTKHTRTHSCRSLRTYIDVMKLQDSLDVYDLCEVGLTQDRLRESTNIKKIRIVMFNKLTATTCSSVNKGICMICL